MDATGTLQLVFDADPWDSTISFARAFPWRSAARWIDLRPGVNVATQSGRTIDLFDWTGVTPTGTFTVSSPYTWNLSNLYTTGEVTLTAVPSLPGDFNHDGTVDAADYVVWRKTGINGPTGYDTWRTNFGQPGGSGSVASANATVPEPTTLVMLIVAAVGIRLRRRRFAYEFHQLVNAWNASSIHPFDDTVKRPGNSSLALDLTLGGRSRRRNAPANQRAC